MNQLLKILTYFKLSLGVNEDSLIIHILHMHGNGTDVNLSCTSVFWRAVFYSFKITQTKSKSW